MQYVRSLGGSVSKTWNSINPATLSGAIDVIVVEQEDGWCTGVLKEGFGLMNPSRISRMLTLSRSLWEVLSAATV